MARLTADFETGVNGNTIATTDPGSATAWNTVTIPTGGSVTYDNAQKAHGSLSGKITCSGTSSAGFFTWSGAAWGTPNDHYGRAYVFWPGGSPAATRLLVFPKNAGSGCCRVQVNTSGKFELCDSAAVVQATSTTSVPAGAAWVRLEWHIVHSNSVGQVVLRIYKTSIDAASASFDEEVSTAANLNTLGMSDSLLVGQILNAASTTLQFDDIVGLDTTWPGPAVAATVAAVSAPLMRIPNAHVGPMALRQLFRRPTWSSVPPVTDASVVGVVGPLVLNSPVAAVVVDATVTGVVGALTLGASAPAVSVAVPSTVGALTLSGSAPSVAASVSATVGQTTLGASAPAVSVAAVPASGQVTLNTTTPSVVFDSSVAATVGVLTLGAGTHTVDTGTSPPVTSVPYFPYYPSAMRDR